MSCVAPCCREQSTSCRERAAGSSSPSGTDTSRAWRKRKRGGREPGGPFTPRRETQVFRKTCFNNNQEPINRNKLCLVQLLEVWRASVLLAVK